MKHRQVKPDDIKIPETRVTARFDEETWEQFKSSIKEVGAIAPVICCEVEGQLVLVDGLHRLVEAKKAGLPSVGIVIIPGDMVDVLTKNIFLDHLRGKTPISEMVQVIEVLSKEYGLDSEKIAEKTGMTRDYVEKLQGISELTPFCREALDEGKIGVGHAEALTRIKDPVRQETILSQLELYHWSVKDLDKYITSVLAIVEAAEAAPHGPEERAPVKVKCFYCRQECDPSELASVLTCRECSGIMIASMVEARRELAAQGLPANKATD